MANIVYRAMSIEELIIEIYHKGRGRIRPQIGPLTFKNFPSRNDTQWEISTQQTFLYYHFHVSIDLYTIPMLTKSSIINTAHIDLQNNWACLPTSLE